MNELQILHKQTRDAYDWANKVLESIPFEYWEETPDIIATNISWQVGHLVLSFYYHSVIVIVGHQKEILENIPIREFSGFFNYETDPRDAIGRIKPEKLLKYLKIMEDKSIEVINSLSLKDLDAPLEPFRVRHPVATNKFEALDWNIKHTMWHCGQIGLVKRVIHQGYNFGLEKN